MYDVIVIGAGNGGLISALELAKKKKSVLVLESSNTPGGFATSFQRGRFEFEVSLRQLNEFGTKENPGKLYKLFESLNILDKIEFKNVPEVFNLIDMSKNTSFILPFGTEEFINQINTYVPGSTQSLQNFFLLASECSDALDYIELNEEIDEKYLYSNYPNFFKVASQSVDKVLNALKMPKKAQEILDAFWFYLGSPTSKLSFVHFAVMVNSYVSLGGKIPTKRSHEISNILAEEITKNGGIIKYSSPVKSILFQDDKISGVELKSGKKYFAKHVICNISPTFVYGDMLPNDYVPKNALSLTNARLLSPSCFSIFLGLNKSAQELGLTNYNYFLYNTLNSNKEYQKMQSLKNTSCVVTVLNNANPSCSPKGTCIVEFTSLLVGDAFSKNLTPENYFKKKEQIAQNIITNFEKTLGVSLIPYIEEIEIASPVTYARYTSHPNGIIYGYKATDLDNIIPRLLNKKAEEYIPNLYFCGGFSPYLSGYNSTYLSGFFAAKSVLQDMKGVDSDE